MDRSYRHTPIVSYTCAKSDKPGKVLANRAFRAAERHALSGCRDYDELIMPVVREVSSVWDFPKDGKHYMKNRLAPWYAKAMRK
jgi:hypothetical protein